MTFKELDHPTRLRMAILKMSADSESARLITPKDVQNVWFQIGQSGYNPRLITEIANISMKKYLQCL